MSFSFIEKLKGYIDEEISSEIYKECDAQGKASATSGKISRIVRGEGEA